MAAIAGHTASCIEAKRVRDMRKYPFWARVAGVLKQCVLSRPERYCAIARRLAARPKENDEERTEAGVFASSFYGNRLNVLQVNAKKKNGSLSGLVFLIVVFCGGMNLGRCPEAPAKSSKKEKL